MQLEWQAKARDAARFWPWVAASCWLLVFAGLFIRLLVANGLHSVYPIFSDAARCWQRGEDMYWPYHKVQGLDSYRYTPAITAFFSIFAGLSDRQGSIVWLTLSAFLLVTALVWWLRVSMPRPLGLAQLAGVALLVLAFAAGNLHNGQTNTIVTAMLLIAAAGTCTERWNLAAACLVVAILFKVYPVAFALLLALVFPRQLIPRLALGLVAGLAFPFVIGRPDYVLQQYQNWFDLLLTDDRKHADLSICYRDLWLLIRVYDLPVSTSIYTLLQGLGALAAAGICFFGQRAGLAVRPLTMLCLNMAALWMMLLGPATESSTYLILAPTLAWFVFDSWQNPHFRLEAALLGICLTCFLAAHMSVWFPETVRRGAILFQPVATLFLAGVLIPRAVREIAWCRMRMPLSLAESGRAAA
ncbi:hypothetical protein BH10PLA2_BH10PLA2_10430 [soil metagenome]